MMCDVMSARCACSKCEEKKMCAPEDVEMKRRSAFDAKKERAFHPCAATGEDLPSPEDPAESPSGGLPTPTAISSTKVLC